MKLQIEGRVRAAEEEEARGMGWGMGDERQETGGGQMGHESEGDW